METKILVSEQPKCKICNKAEAELSEPCLPRLTIEHLAPYLPYKLLIVNKSLKGEILNTYKMVADNFEDCGISNVLYGVNQIPVLRPLSDLTKEIEHNGEKICPLWELFKLSLGDVSISKIPKEYTTNIKDDSINLICKKFLFGFDLLDSSFCLVLNNVITPCNQLKMFQKLFEWHFNVFNLPENLFIDINTLTHE